MNKYIIVVIAVLLFAVAAAAQTILNGGGSAGGGVTSITAGCATTTGGSPITTTGTIAAVEPVDTEAGSNFAIPNSDCGFLVNLSNASAQTPTIAQSGMGGLFPAGWYADVCNIGAGTQTLTPATSFIGPLGSTSYAFATGQCARVISDGSNYQIAATPLGLSGATIAGTSAVPFLNIIGTWNTSGGSAMIFGTMGCTSCNNAFFERYQLLGSDKFTIDAFGDVFASAGGSFGSHQIFVVDNSNGLRVTSAKPIGFTPSNNEQVAADTVFTRAAAATMQHGFADAASPIAQTITFQNVISGTSNTAGVNATYIGSLGTGTGPSGNIIFEVGVTGTTGTVQNSPAAMLSVNAGSATTAAIQFGNGSTFTKYDSCTALTTGATGIIACTASAMRFKIPLSWGVSTDLSALRPASWKYKDQQQFGEGEFVGLYADDVEKMDPRCVVYDHGELKDYRDRCVIAHLVAIAQKQQAEIEQLKRAH